MCEGRGRRSQREKKKESGRKLKSGGDGERGERGPVERPVMLQGERNFCINEQLSKETSLDDNIYTHTCTMVFSHRTVEGFC